MKNNPVDQVKLLRERVKQIATDLGLDLHAFTLSPGDEHDPDTIQAVFMIGLTAIESDDETEKRQTDEAFEALVGFEFEGESTNEDEEADAERVRNQQEAAREALGDWLDGD